MDHEKKALWDAVGTGQPLTTEHEQNRSYSTTGEVNLPGIKGLLVP